MLDMRTHHLVFYFISHHHHHRRYYNKVCKNVVFFCELQKETKNRFGEKITHKKFEEEVQC